ncbi:MAG TPA: GntR family transcriptional regulator [Clostridiales bacterium]|nr:GntR family transcriptional regulator [Clostridiales bacterium]
MLGIPLYKQIINDILEKIFDGTLRPGDRIPSEHELSSTYMVSSITSKNALAELADKGYIIRKKGKGSFVNSLENLMAIPSFSNTSTYRSAFHSKTIGLILPSMKTGIDQQLLNAIEEEISKTDYLLTLTITRENQEKESAAIEKLKLQGASGLIIFPTEHELYNESILKLNIEKYPFVLVDRWLRGIRTNTVMINNYDVTKKATEHLFAKGHRDIVFLSPDSRNTVTEDRLAGFKDCLLEHGITLNPHNTCMIPSGVTDPKEKKELIRDFLNDNPAVNGIICSNKEMATYIIAIFDQDNLWERYGVCAFDYYNHARISYVEQDIAQIAKECIDILLDTIRGDTAPKQVCVPAEFHPV